MDQRIGMRLSQQQLRFVKLLEYNAPELDEAVERELEDNPALSVKEEHPEEDTRRYPGYSASSGTDMSNYVQPDDSESLYDSLYQQLSEKRLDPKVEFAAKYIIGNLDANGYLHRDINLLRNDMAFGPGVEISPEEAAEALTIVKSLEPVGIGASNLQETLLLQLQRLPQSAERDNAIRILEECYEAFTMKHKHKIMSALKLTERETDAALDLILSLNPKPGASLGHGTEDHTNIIIPDFIVTNEDGNIHISLNNRIPELQIDESFSQAMENLERSAKGRVKKGSEFVVTRYNDARDFIKVLTHRQQTMMDVMRAIVKIQKEYFLTEDVYTLKPMMIKNVSEETGLDLSVISRATANKFVATPWGIFPLRFFFSDTVGETSGDAPVATNRKIEAEIKAMVDKEDKQHPLSDQRIMEEMNKKGYELSRRTVAKYRDRIGVPVARLRKEL